MGRPSKHTEKRDAIAAKEKADAEEIERLKAIRELGRGTVKGLKAEIRKFLEDNWAVMTRDILELPAKERVAAMQKLMEYSVSKQSSVKEENGGGVTVAETLLGGVSGYDDE